MEKMAGEMMSFNVLFVNFCRSSFWCFSPDKGVERWSVLAFFPKSGMWLAAHWERASRVSRTTLIGSVPPQFSLCRDSVSKERRFLCIRQRGEQETRPRGCCCCLHAQGHSAVCLRTVDISGPKYDVC